VSAFEPQLPSEPKVDMPDFMIVLRGFDRRQVEMWAAEVANQIEQERLRADEAEKRAYRAQIETSGAPSFSHLGSHVASILEEAGKSSENMLADAAERAQEAIDAAEEEAAEIIKAAEHRAGEIEEDAAGIVRAAEQRAGEIEGDARRTLEGAQAEGARVEEDALQAAEEMRAQAEQDARAVLEEARDATDMIWQEAERERLGVEAETIRLETLRHRSLEQLGRVYGHLESVLDEVRAGIGRVEEEEQDLAEATAAAAARLGVEPPASSPEDSPRFPDHRLPAQHDLGEDDGGEDDQEEDDDGEAMLSATRPDTPSTSAASTGITPGASSSATDTTPGTSGSPTATALGATASPPSATPASTATASDAPGLAADTTQPQQPALTDADAADRSADGGTDATQPIVANGSADATTQTVPAAMAGPDRPAAGGLAPDQDATQRLEPVGKPRNPKAPGKEGKPRP
jgi:hypothetical protein